MKNIRTECCALETDLQLGVSLCSWISAIATSVDRQCLELFLTDDVYEAFC